MQSRAVDLAALLAKIRGGLLVSCQAQPDEPLFGAEVMVKLAHATLEGGAVGIRANSPVDVAAIRQALPDVPLIGLYKFDLPGYEVRITPTWPTPWNWPRPVVILSPSMLPCGPGPKVICQASSGGSRLKPVCWCGRHQHPGRSPGRHRPSRPGGPGFRGSRAQVGPGSGKPGLRYGPAGNFHRRRAGSHLTPLFRAGLRLFCRERLDRPGRYPA